MDKYDFELTDFALSKTGIHLLRSSFNYKTILYYEVDEVVLKKALETKRPVISIIFGICLISFTFFYVLSLFTNFNDPRVHRIYIESIILPALPFILGLYLLYISVKKEPVLQVVLGKERYILRIRELINKNAAVDLKKYLNQKLPNKFVTQDNL